jgi:hypothetical protein
MADKENLKVEREKLRLEADLQQFVKAVKGTMVLTPEEKKGAKAISDSLKFDQSVQEQLQPIVEIAIQSNFWKAKSDLKATWIQGSVMRLAEGIFKYTRVKGGLTGGIRGILKALNWGKTQAYVAKELSETFGDDLLKMPVGITAAKLAELLERRKQDKKHGEIFNPKSWLDQNRQAFQDAQDSRAVKELLGIVKEKKTPKPKSVETEENPDPTVEVITVLNIVAKFKPCEEVGLNDVVLKCVSDTQVAGLKNWLKAQQMLGEEDESVRRPDTLEKEPSFPEWQEVVPAVIKDDGKIDLSSVYGSEETGYVIPTYEGLTIQDPQPIRTLAGQDFPSTSEEWLNLVGPLFAAQPDCIGLTLFDEVGKFVVESRTNGGGSLETKWVKPASAGAAMNA